MANYEEKLLQTYSYPLTEPVTPVPFSLLEDILEYPKEEKKKKQKQVPPRYLLN